MIAENNTSFCSSFQQEFLSTSSEFTFGDNSDKSSIFYLFIKNLVDRDLTEYQITQTLTLSRLHASSGADKGNQIVPTRNMLTGANKGNPTV